MSLTVTRMPCSSFIDFYELHNLAGTLIFDVASILLLIFTFGIFFLILI
jgi:hypothetical protein